ncbi:hypothetical protein Y1Q_0014831 [Alligator mississippiensis]|uniref:Uncharacterized protein n=1 Tax=Alligator mississippiensis TaxID=8496 RepID=A0A151M225_ALLMI|nr:hypothetical protein Y1Q_0014831 [Alligator mississippiensis]
MLVNSFGEELASNFALPSLKEAVKLSGETSSKAQEPLQDKVLETLWMVLRQADREELNVDKTLRLRIPHCTFVSKCHRHQLLS